MEQYTPLVVSRDDPRSLIQVHVDDVAGFILHSIENDNVNGIYNAVAPQASTNTDFSKALAAAMWRPAIFPLPGYVRVICVVKSVSWNNIAQK